MRIQITLKSGTQIEVDVTEFKTERNRVTGALESVEWVTPPGYSSKLLTLELPEIAAVVRIAVPGEAQ